MGEEQVISCADLEVGLHRRADELEIAAIGMHSQGLSSELHDVLEAPNEEVLSRAVVASSENLLDAGGERDCICHP